MPSSPTELPTIDDAWILQQRGPRNRVVADRPYAHLVEPERTADGTLEDVLTIFLTNRECPFRCLMCDLWKNTTERRVPNGSITRQVEWALAQHDPVKHVKLYNSGNFFDAQAIPQADWHAMVRLLRKVETVIVECHPRLIDARCLEFADLLGGRLQVALGLETVDPRVLPKLNKKMSLPRFEQATSFLLDHKIDVRAFVLLRAPFQSERQGLVWAKRSLDYAFSIGVECCALIPTRAGNGAMENLRKLGHYAPPTLPSIEAVLDYGVGQSRGRVFMDLWDMEKFIHCWECGQQRVNRIRQMNLMQEVLPPVACHCGTSP